MSGAVACRADRRNAGYRGGRTCRARAMSFGVELAVLRLSVMGHRDSTSSALKKWAGRRQNFALALTDSTRSSDDKPIQVLAGRCVAQEPLSQPISKNDPEDTPGCISADAWGRPCHVDCGFVTVPISCAVSLSRLFDQPFLPVMPAEQQPLWLRLLATSQSSNKVSARRTGGGRRKGSVPVHVSERPREQLAKDDSGGAKRPQRGRCRHACAA